MFFTTYLPLIFGLNVSFLRSLFVFSLSARAARTVICSFIVRHLFVHCSSFVRSLFVLCSFFVRLFSICPCGSHRHLFVFASLQFPLFEGVGGGYLCLFFICLSCYDCPCGSHLPVWLTPLTLHFLLNCFPILIKILHRDFFPVKANIFKLFCYLTTFAYNDDSEVF